MSKSLGYYVLINTNYDAVERLNTQFLKLTQDEKKSCLIHLAVLLEHNQNAVSTPATKDFVHRTIEMLQTDKLTKANLLGIVRALADQTV